MRRTTLLNLFLLVVLAITTSVVTSAIAGRPKKAQRTNAVPVVTQPSKSGFSFGRQDGRGGALQPAPGATSYASGAMQSFEAEAVGRNLHIVAQAYVRDTRPNMKYVWKVR